MRFCATGQPRFTPMRVTILIDYSKVIGLEFATRLAFVEHALFDMAEVAWLANKS